MPGLHPTADVRELAAELAAAWECAGVFGSDHAAFLARGQRVEALAASVPPGHHAVEITVTAHGLSLGDETLTPASRFTALRAALIDAGFGCLRVLAGCRASDVPAAIDVIARLRRGQLSPAQLPDALSDATSGRIVGVRPRLADAVAATRQGDPQESNAGREGATLAALAAASGARRSSGSASAPVPARSVEPTPEHHAAAAARLHALAACDPHVRHTELSELGRSLATMPEAERAAIMHALSGAHGLDADSAATLLAAAPVRSVAEGMAALERPDARVSLSALMLLRRLSTLAVGSIADQRRVHDALASLAATDATLTADQAVTRLLERNAATEFRSDEYTAVIDRLGASLGGPRAQMSGEPPAIVGVDEDLSVRALEAVVLSVTEPSTWTLGRADAVRTVAARAHVIASAGHADTVIALLHAAERAAADPHTDPDLCTAWSSLAAAAAAESWLGVALARCADAELVRTALAAGTPVGAASLLVLAAPHTRTPRERAALLVAAGALHAGALADAVLRAAHRTPCRIAGLAWLIEHACPGVIADVAGHALDSGDDADRLAALDLAQRSGTTLRTDVLRAAVADHHDAVRMRAHTLLARQPSGPAALAKILAGHAALPALTLRECVNLGALLDESPGYDADDIARGALANAATTGEHARNAPALAEFLRRRRPGHSARLAVMAWSVSPWRLAARPATAPAAGPAATPPHPIATPEQPRSARGYAA